MHIFALSLYDGSPSMVKHKEVEDIIMINMDKLSRDTGLTSGATKVQFSGGTRGCTTFSIYLNILYPAASNGDLFFQHSEWGHPGGTDLGWGNVPLPPCPP